MIKNEKNSHINRMLQVAFLFMIAFAYQCKSSEVKKEDGWVEATGRAAIVDDRLGRAKDDATMDAKREAVAIKLGTLIKGTSHSVDNIMQESSIKSQTEGFIEKYEVIKALPISKWEYEVRIRALVKEGKLKESIESLLENVGHPRIMVVATETMNGKATAMDTRAGAVVESSLTRSGYPMVDKAISEKIISRNRALIRSSISNPQRIRSIVADSGAEVFILVDSKIKNAGLLEGTKMNSMQAVITVKAVDITSGRILSSEVGDGAYPHVSPETGASRSVKKAWAKIQNPFEDTILKKWQPNRTQMIAVTIVGLDYDGVKEFRSLLLELRGVKNVYRRGVTGNQSRLDVSFQGTSFILLDRITDNPKGFTVRQKDVKQSSMVLEVRKK